MRNMAKFRQAVERLQTECQRRSLELPLTALNNILIGVVRDMAGRLRVKEETVVRTYLDGVDLGALADDLVRAETEQKKEVAEASPAVIGIETTGRLVASLAQVVRCVSLNHQKLAGDPADKWTAIGVLDEASNALTLLGDALENHDNAPQGVTILWNDECVVYTRHALSRTMANLRAGTWSFGHGAELDTRVADRLQTDLASLPQR